ncbi:MAG: hypothetical protein Q9228_004078 [Teloschistes exilis]
MWPVSGILFIIVSPHIANQIHANPHMSMQRPPLLPQFFKPIAGGPNMFDMREHDWKPWRAIFSKAFSAEYVVSLIPDMVDETMVYSETLKKFAEQKQMFQLDLITLRFTIDVIGKTILNAHLGAQRGYNVLADCMLNQIRWHQANGDKNPFDDELSKRYREYKADQGGERTKAIVDLVLQSYIPEQLGLDSKTSGDDLDPSFRAFAVSQIGLFTFVGHDSTSSTISILKSQPFLINDLRYTTAVIKEALRLFPPGGCSRAGRSDVALLSDSGQKCPTGDVAAVFTVHPELQRSPVYWPRPDTFLPERWLVKLGHELYPIKGAYRAFEIGPRNCVAQGFVMTELKVILAGLVRQFDFSPANEDLNHQTRRAKVTTYRGERAYQIEEGAAHPADHYPCRVSIRKRG